MLTLSSALIAELGLIVTRPGYLVQVGYSVPMYLSTLGNITWNAHAWTGSDVKVSGLSQDGKGASGATLQIGNTDGAIGVVVLSDGAADIPVSIWAVYAGATASGDPVQRFGGVTNGATIDADKVTFTLTSTANTTLNAPRFFIGQINGFNQLKTAGTVINWGAEAYTLPGSPVWKSRGAN